MIEALLINPDIQKQQEAQSHIVMSKEDLARILQDQENTYIMNPDTIIYPLDDDSGLDNATASIESAPMITPRYVINKERRDSEIANTFNAKTVSLGNSIDIIKDGQEYTLSIERSPEIDTMWGHIHIRHKRSGRTLRLERGIPELNWVGRKMGGEYVKELCQEGKSIEWINGIEIHDNEVLIHATMINDNNEEETFTAHLNRGVFDQLFDPEFFVQGRSSITFDRDEVMNDHIRKIISNKYGSFVGGIAEGCFKNLTFIYSDPIIKQ